MITGFFHIACLGNSWKRVTDEIMSNIVSSGLYAKTDVLYVGVLGLKKHMAELASSYHKLDKIKLIYHGDDMRQYEFPTIKAIQDFVKDSKGFIYHVHTKGVAKDGSNPFVKYSRKYLIENVINQYEKHIKALMDGYDISGNMWTSGTHYEGNFWWADAAHLKKLQDIDELRKTPITKCPGNTDEEKLRMQPALWISTRKGIRVRDFGTMNVQPSFHLKIEGKVDEQPECLLNHLGFDKIYFINLLKRIDRSRNVVAEMRKIGLRNVQRFEAINAQKLGITKNGLDNPGLVGCFLSHHLILQEAIQKNYKRILVFEDDVTFVNGFNEILQYVYPQVPQDWEILYLGHYEKEGYKVEKRVAENVYIPNNSWGFQAYMVQNEGIKKMYDALQEIKDHVDVQILKDAVPKMKAYEIMPSLCPQGGMSSDIQNNNNNKAQKLAAGVL